MVQCRADTLTNVDPPKDKAITYTTTAPMFGWRDGYIISLGKSANRLTDSTLMTLVPHL
jgi:hypothetical protein